jgi:hypothetical protein
MVAVAFSSNTLFPIPPGIPIFSSQTLEKNYQKGNKSLNLLHPTIGGSG